MKDTLIGGFLLLLMLTACGPQSETTTTDTPKAETNSEVETAPSDTPETKADAESKEPAEGVEITLKDELDGILNSYCLDIAGGNKNVDPDKGLQAHTCYSYQGELGTDQVFDPSRFADNTLYMPNYDVCATLTGLESGAKVGLATCESSDLQTIAFTGEGKISPVSAPNMCFTAAQESRFGRGSQHQIRDLTLESCSDDLASVQQWRTRTTDD